MCFKPRKNVYGSTFQEKHYTLCSVYCKELFIRETLEFEKKLNQEALETPDEYTCSRCKENFSKYRDEVLQDEHRFCSELCRDVFNGKISPFYWIKRK